MMSTGTGYFRRTAMGKVARLAATAAKAVLGGAPLPWTPIRRGINPPRKKRTDRPKSITAH